MESEENDSCFGGDNGLHSVQALLRAPFSQATATVLADRVGPHLSAVITLQATSNSLPTSSCLVSKFSMCSPTQLPVQGSIIAWNWWAEEPWSLVWDCPSQGPDLSPQRSCKFPKCSLSCHHIQASDPHHSSTQIVERLLSPAKRSCVREYG